MVGSLHHFVESCTVFENWPVWGDEVLLRWLLNQTPRIALAEIEVPSTALSSAVLGFINKHVAGRWHHQALWTQADLP
jgi:hypothetical protein